MNQPDEQDAADRAQAHRWFAAAFAEWERRYREEPGKFQSDFERFTKETPDSYGEACAAFFAGLLDEVAAQHQPGA